MGKTAAADADGVDLCHVFGNGTECGHGAEGDTLEIHVETCNYDALACVGQIDAYAHQFVIENCASSMPTTSASLASSTIAAAVLTGVEWMALAS